MRARQETTRVDVAAADELRASLSSGGVLPPRAASQLLPPLVDILLEERAAYSRLRLRFYQTTVGIVGMALAAFAGLSLANAPEVAVLLCLGIVCATAYAVWQAPDRTRTGAPEPRQDRSRRERALTHALPLSPLHRQAIDSLAEMLRRSGRDAATRETLPALVRLADGLERSAFSAERRLARAAGAAIKGLLPHLTGGDPLRDPDVLRFLRHHVAAGVERLPGVEGAFYLSPHRSPAAGSVYDWEFTVAALLMLGEAGDDATVPIAEALNRHHPFEKIRIAAEECLRAHRQAGR